MGSERIALIAGSTGLVGRALVKLLTESGYYKEIIVLSRKRTFDNNPDITEKVIDFDQLSKELRDVKADHIYCCLGTTMNDAGSKNAFYKVDFTYPFELAQVMHANGAKKYLIVTALGANHKSVFYYNRVKGEVERALNTLGYSSLLIFRPSLLLGERKDLRTGEEFAKKFYKMISFLFFGPFKKYRGIEAGVVARSMFLLAKKDNSGRLIYESDQISEIVGDSDSGLQ